MKTEWKTLSELSTDGAGHYGIAASAVPYSKELYTYLRITDISDNGTLNRGALKSVRDKKARDYLLRPNDIVFARTGASVGRNYFYDTRDGELVFAGFLIKFSLDPEKINPKYVKYYCLSRGYKDWISQVNTGSTRGNINAKTFGSMPVPVVPRAQQDALASILSSLDDKIELNDKINANLEEQARAIFKSWFVDNPFQVEKETTLGNVCRCELGGTPSRNEPEYWNGNIPWINSGEVNEFRITSPSEYITEEGLRNSSTKLLPAKTTVLAITGATLGQVSLLEIESCANQSVVGIVPSETLPYEFIYPLILIRINELMSHQTGGAQQHINKQNIEGLPVAIPAKPLLDKYRLAVAPLLEMIGKNSFENLRLSSLRDALIPRLLSGELDVSKLTGGVGV